MAERKKATSEKNKGTGVGVNGNLHPVRTSEEAKKRGSRGGKKSAEIRKLKRDAKEAAQLVLNMGVGPDSDKILEQLGYQKKDRTNLVAIMARLALQAQSKGDLESAKLLLMYAGEDHEDQRKNEESKARIAVMGDKNRSEALTVTSNEGETSDVVIYLPAQEKIEDEEEDEEDVANGEQQDT